MKPRRKDDSRFHSSTRTGRPDKDGAADRIRFLTRRKPHDLHFPCLKVVIRDKTERVVDVANLPSGGLSELVLAEIAGFHPEYHFSTPDGDRIAVSRILRIRTRNGEAPFVPQAYAAPTEFAPLRVSLRLGGLVAQEMANIPATENGIKLVKQLLHGDDHDGLAYARHDFLNSGYGWIPISWIDPKRVPYEPGATDAPAQPLPRHERHMDGDCYG